MDSTHIAREHPSIPAPQLPASDAAPGVPGLIVAPEPGFLALETGTPDTNGVIGIKGRTLVGIWPGSGMGRRQIGSLHLEDADARTAIGS